MKLNEMEEEQKKCLINAFKKEFRFPVIGCGIFLFIIEIILIRLHFKIIPIILVIAFVIALVQLHNEIKKELSSDNW